ncbi:hypothetical protein C804_06318 [Lachnospiraceae bacterium A4]|nr:hypothetical protein C804_06318 [Lachnospiraceae bacterium A4]
MKLIKIQLHKFASICVFFYILFLGFVISMQCEIAPYSKKLPGIDESVFETMGYLMTKGYIPYRDSFDHKGPLLYIINWLGMQISYYRGIWIIELIVITSTFFILYKITRLVCGRLGGCFSMFVISSSLLFYLDGGNLVEEYAMPFIAVSVYFFLDYFLNQKISIYRLIICGFSFGAVLLLRANMISVWICFCIAVFIQLISNKQYKKIIEFILWFLSGMMLILLPVFIWLALNHAFKDFWNDYIIFNKMYVSNSVRATLLNKFNSFQYFLNNVLIIGSTVMTVYLCRLKRGYCDIAYLICLMVTLPLISMSGMSYAHYGMVLVPLMAYPIANFISSGKLYEKNAGISIVIIWLLINYTITPFGTAVSHLIENYINRNIDQRNGIYDIVELIENNTDEQDKITVWGNWNIIYLLSKRMPASKYSYQFPIAEVDESIYEEYFNDLELTPPTFVIVKPGRELGRMAEYLDTHREYSYFGKVNDADIYYRETVK